MIIWTAAKYSDFTTLVKGSGTVSGGVVVSGGISLKWKKAKKDGTWPSDSEAITIATLTKSVPIEVRQVAGGPNPGMVIIGSPLIGFWRPKTNNPKQASDFERVTVVS